MAIRLCTAADLPWVEALVNLGYPIPLTDDSVRAILDTADAKTVVWGDPDVPTFCRLRVQAIPADHSYPFSGLCTQVTDLHPRAELDIDHMLTHMAPLLARCLFEMGELVTMAKARPVFAFLPSEVIARWQTVFPTARVHAVETIWLPKLSTAIQVTAPWR